MIAEIPNYGQESDLDELGLLDDAGGFCGTIALEQSMGIGIWNRPTENDLLVGLLRP